MEPRAMSSRVWLSIGSFMLPVLKCAVCPVCLGMFGSVVAGARLGFLADERLHGALIVFAIALDAGILTVALRHHRQLGPLLVCCAGALLALLGHFGLRTEVLEYVGFAMLMAASLWNVGLMLAHPHSDGACCVHEAESELEQESP